MKANDPDIGIPLIRGQRLDIKEKTISFVIDSTAHLEILLLESAEGRKAEIVGATAQGPYRKEKFGSTVRVEIDLDRLNEGTKLILSVYVTTGFLKNVLATVGSPRRHLALRCDESGAVDIFEIYRRHDAWRIKVSGDEYKDGLQALLQAHE
jgi:hypothetical protein